MFELFACLFAIFGSIVTSILIGLIICGSIVALVVFILAILELRKAIAKILDKHNERRK